MSSVDLHGQAHALERVLPWDRAFVHRRAAGLRVPMAHVTGPRSEQFQRRRSPSSVPIRS